ncbi:hypothetical protein TcCL_ESM10126 [Trypanosoma cruzi]|nr:hypothetical protein TcCL_ESM10126 [Trypanosoma cruzi]
MQFTAHRMDSQSFTPKKMLHHTSKMSLIRSTAPHGIVLLDAILAAMLPTRRITTFTFTWGKWEYSYSSLRRKLDFLQNLLFLPGIFIYDDCVGPADDDDDDDGDDDAISGDLGA